jgi:hypothetical protein
MKTGRTEENGAQPVFTSLYFVESTILFFLSPPVKLIELITLHRKSPVALKCIDYIMGYDKRIHRFVGHYGSLIKAFNLSWKVQ